MLWNMVKVSTNLVLSLVFTTDIVDKRHNAAQCLSTLTQPRSVWVQVRLGLAFSPSVRQQPADGRGFRPSSAQFPAGHRQMRQTSLSMTFAIRSFVHFLQTSAHFSWCQLPFLRYVYRKVKLLWSRPAPWDKDWRQAIQNLSNTDTRVLTMTLPLCGNVLTGDWARALLRLAINLKEISIRRKIS